MRQPLKTSLIMTLMCVVSGCLRQGTSVQGDPPQEDMEQGLDQGLDQGSDTGVDQCVVDGEDDTCDTVDNDCDGRVDEGYTLEATLCGLGVCAQEGVRLCTNMGVEVDTCSPSQPATNVDELCDGLDQDCDGSVDEDFSAPSCGVGACEVEGVCLAGEVTCEPSLPEEGDTDQLCDGVDSDCDGALDEGFIGDTCGLGVCVATAECTEMGPVCTPGEPYAYETCDGEDDDCDGQVDEGCFFTCEQRPPLVSLCPEDLVFMSIPGGSFIMGSDTDAENEAPAHEVSVTPFELSVTEVTVAQYQACVDAGRCSEPGSNGAKCNWGRMGRESHPINCVDWGQARTFAKWLGRDVDLPTEAEWEYAARGGEDYLYAGSDDLDSVAWYALNSDLMTHPVGTKLVNGYGLADMTGNVFEWVLDERHDDYVGAPSVSSEVWGAVPDCDPICGADATSRIARGGSFDFNPDYLRLTIRFRFQADIQLHYLGFRVRRSPPR